MLTGILPVGMSVSKGDISHLYYGLPSYPPFNLITSVKSLSPN
jgi:hypothetical protein